MVLQIFLFDCYSFGGFLLLVNVLHVLGLLLEAIQIHSLVLQDLSATGDVQDTHFLKNIILIAIQSNNFVWILVLKFLLLHFVQEV